MKTEKFDDYKAKPTELVGRMVKEDTRYNTRILQIARVTPTQIVLENGTKLRYDGSEIGRKSSWTSPDYTLLTEKGVEEVQQRIADDYEHHKLSMWLYSVERQKQPLNVLRAMKEAFDKLQNP